MTRAGRSMLMVVVLMAAVVGCSSEDKDGGNEDGARRFADPKSGLTYLIPDGWFGPETEDLIGFFTSTIASEEPESESGSQGPVALAGPGLFDTTAFDPTGESLRDAANGAVASFAEFFVPFPGQRETLIDEEIEVSGHRAWHVRIRIEPDDPASDVATADIVAVDLPEPAYLIGITTGEDQDLQGAVDTVIKDLRAD